MIPAVGKSGAGTTSISSSTVISGLASSAQAGVDDLGEVVRRDVGRHAHGNAGRPVDEQIGQPRGKHRRLHLLAVVIGHEIDGFPVDVGEHLRRDLLQPALRVAVGRCPVAVDRAEVALPVDQRVAQRELLHHPHERLVGRRIAVRMVFAEHVADDARAFHVGPVPDRVRLVHREQHAAVDGLQPVAHVRQRAADDHAHRVIEIGMPHLGFEAYRQGFFRKLLHGWGILPLCVMRGLRSTFRVVPEMLQREVRKAASGIPPPCPASRLRGAGSGRGLGRALKTQHFITPLQCRDTRRWSVAKTRLSFAPAPGLCYIFERNKGFGATVDSPVFHRSARITGPQKLVQNQSLRGEIMTRRLVTGALVGAMAAVFSAGVSAQANPTNSGYVLSATGAPDNNVVRSGNYGDPRSSNLCWRTGYWTPAMAIVECDPDLVPKPAPAPAPAAAPPPPPAARAGARTGPCSAGAEDHAGVQGAVRLRQGRAETRRQGRDRHRDHRQAQGRPEARAGPRHRAYRPDRLAGVQPEAVRAPRRLSPRLPRVEGRRQGQDRDPRHGQDAAGSRA